ncbi:MAG TPA: Calx-beta domain-containing protein, partial [Actinomycetota bacterium]|nr:Calx-beta domain-containing protein [Actinomycetota bacterium]
AEEIFFVDLSSPNGATIADGRGDGTIVDDDDPTPSVSIGDVTVTEGNSGTTSAVFTVSLSGASGTDVTIPYSTADGTATAGSDYTAASGTLTIPAGQTSRTLAIAVTGDTVDETDEPFFVNMGSPTGATVADGQGQGTITDDDEPPPSTAPELSIGDASVLEGPPGTKTALRLTVTLSSPQPTNVTFSYASVDHTATAASGDYVAKSGTGTIVAGATTTTLRVDVRGDAIDEAEEIFFVDLSSPNGATIADGRGEGTIVDDDP